MPTTLSHDYVLRIILDVWRTTLRIRRIERDDNFYALGGTSLAAAQVAAWLSKGLHVRVRVGDILRAPTALALASAIIAAGSADITDESLLTRIGNSEPAPGTVQQQAVWFLEQLDPDSRAYNTVTAVALEGRVRSDLLNRALAVLVERHAILRTTFPTRDGILVQRVHERGVVDFDQIELGDVGHDMIETFLGKLGRHRFDVRALPLIRWSLAQLTTNRFILAQVEHHFVHDGWSMWILLTELAAVYKSLVTGSEINLPPLELDYETYGRWQRHWLESEEAGRQRRWWTKILGEVTSVYRFPADERRPPYFTSEGGTVAAVLPEALRRHVVLAAARASVTPFAVFMAAFAVFLGAAAGVDKLVLGSMLRGRGLPGSEHIVGMFVNTVALPISGWMTSTFDDFARDVFATLVAAQDQEGVPFPVVVHELDLPRQLSRNPIFQVCFSMNDWPSQQLDFGPELAASVSFPSNGGAKFDLDVVLADPRQCSFLWRYYRPLFSHQDVIGMAERYEVVLSKCLNSGRAQLCQVAAA